MMWYSWSHASWPYSMLHHEWFRIHFQVLLPVSGFMFPYWYRYHSQGNLTLCSRLHILRMPGNGRRTWTWLLLRYHSFILLSCCMFRSVWSSSTCIRILQVETLYTTGLKIILPRPKSCITALSSTVSMPVRMRLVWVTEHAFRGMGSYYLLFRFNR